MTEKKDDSLFPHSLLTDPTLRTKWVKLALEQNNNIMTAFFLSPPLSMTESHDVISTLYQQDVMKPRVDRYDWLRILSPHLQTQCKKQEYRTNYDCNRLLKALYSHSSLTNPTVVSSVLRATDRWTEHQVIECANSILEDIDLLTRDRILNDIRAQYSQLSPPAGSQIVVLTSKAKEAGTWKKGRCFYDANIVSINNNGEFVLQYYNQPVTKPKYPPNQVVRVFWNWKYPSVSYPATIVSLNKDNTYVVRYHDGDIDSNCPESCIKSASS